MDGVMAATALSPPIVDVLKRLVHGLASHGYGLASVSLVVSDDDHTRMRDEFAQYIGEKHCPPALRILGVNILKRSDIDPGPMRYRTTIKYDDRIEVIEGTIGA